MRKGPRHPRPAALSEHGFAVPTVLLALVAAVALASSAVVASIGAQKGTSRDQNSKAALAAAEAGIANALLRFNQSPTTGLAGTTCVPLGGTAVGANGWCPTQITGTLDRATYTYAVKPIAAGIVAANAPAQIEIVSKGTIDGITRRVDAIADGYSSNFKPFSSLANVIGLDGISLTGTAEVTGSVATNGNIGMGSGSQLHCNSAKVGIGRGFSPNDGTVDSACTVTQGTISLPPVNPGDVATNNSNFRICNTSGTPPIPADPITPANKCASAWNPTTKVLDLPGGGTTITLGAPGGTFNYAFCRMVLNANSNLYVAGGASVRIYLLSPDSPPCTGVTTPLDLRSGSKLQPTGAGAADLGILIVGSETRATTAIFNASASYFGCDQTIALYAPRTAVQFASKTELCGGVAGKSLFFASGNSIKASNTALDFELPAIPGISHYDESRDFVECTVALPTGATAPDAGC
jgi:Tfp pilus assembly protein PilX